MFIVSTPSGLKWSLLNPRTVDVDVGDISHNLALQPRFNGSAGSYSVAEHCCHIHDEARSRIYPRDWCFLALLHDAHEAYIGDLVTPVANALDILLMENLQAISEV